MKTANKGNMQSHWEFGFWRRLLLTFGNVTVISIKTRVFVKIIKKHMKFEN